MDIKDLETYLDNNFTKFWENLRAEDLESYLEENVSEFQETPEETEKEELTAKTKKKMEDMPLAARIVILLRFFADDTELSYAIRDTFFEVEAENNGTDWITRVLKLDTK